MTMNKQLNPWIKWMQLECNYGILKTVILDCQCYGCLTQGEIADLWVRLMEKFGSNSLKWKESTSQVIPKNLVEYKWRNSPKPHINRQMETKKGY